jgi:hypothetical protein
MSREEIINGNQRIYDRLIQWWLAGVLLLFPFVRVITKHLTGDSHTVKYLFIFLDEITIVILFPIAFLQLCKSREILNSSYLIIIAPVMVFCLSGLISGLVNDNRLFITILGTFDYIKYFFVIFIYAVFFREFSKFRKIFHLLLILAVVLSVSAIIEEIWALIFRYFLGKSVLDPIVYLYHTPPHSIELSNGIWRFGLLRATSVINQYTILAFFCLFILTLYASVNKNMNRLTVGVLLAGILVTFSRMAYASLFIMGLSRKLHNKWLLVSFVSLALILVTFLSLSVKIGEPPGEYITFDNYRQFARHKAMEVWNDHPFWGRGPGMFGGIISRYFQSPVYKEYEYPAGLLKLFGGIDQFWPQVFAELGLIGVILFATILASVVLILMKLKDKITSSDFKGLINALLIFGIAVYIFTLGLGFNSTVIIFTYFAFLGTCLGNITARRK